MSSNQVQSSTKAVMAQGVLKNFGKGAKKTTHQAPSKAHRNRFLSFDRMPTESTTKWVRVETPMTNPDFQEAASKMMEAVPGSRATRIETTSVIKYFRYRDPETRLSTTGIFEVPLETILDDLREYFPESDIREIQFTSQ